MPQSESTRVTQATASGVSSHQIGFNGTTGGMFWCMLIGLVLYTIAFATTGWQKFGNYKVGLWDTCICDVSLPYTDSAWFDATIAMITIGLIFLLLAFVFLVIYMWFHSLNKDRVLIAFIVCTALTVLFALIGYIVFGAETAKDKNGGGGLAYGFVLSVVGATLCFVAMFLGLWQWKKARAM